MVAAFPTRQLAITSLFVNVDLPWQIKFLSLYLCISNALLGPETVTSCNSKGFFHPNKKLVDVDHQRYQKIKHSQYVILTLVIENLILNFVSSMITE